jgi:hypothetical protein
MEQLLALLVGHLLRVVEAGERPYAVASESAVVEEHARDDERPGERPASSLVRTRHEAHAELPIMCEEPLTARAGHAVEDRR